MSTNELLEFTDELAKREVEIKDYLQNVSILGSRETALTDAMKGISIINGNLPELAVNGHRRVFFSRPLMNLSYSNLIMSRKLARLMVNKDESIEQYVRLCLDPRLHHGELLYNGHHDRDVPEKFKKPLKSRLIGSNQPFIPILTNTLKTFAGWPDTVLEQFMSSPGVKKEMWGWTNSLNRIYTGWDATAVFNNVLNQPAYLLFDTWAEYQSMLSEGTAMPWFDHQLGRRVDYQTGIWTFVLLEDNRTISHVAKTIAWPITNPTGKVFNFDSSQPVKTEDTSINMQFKCLGAEYDDPIILKDFNKLVASYNPSLRRRALGFTSNFSDEYVEIPPDLYPIFSTVAIPFVDLGYKKLEWLVKVTDIRRVKKSMLSI